MILETRNQFTYLSQVGEVRNSEWFYLAKGFCCELAILVIDNATCHTEKVTVICVNLVYLRDDTLNGICCISMEHPRAPTAIESYLCYAAERVMIYIYIYIIYIYFGKI